MDIFENLADILKISSGVLMIIFLLIIVVKIVNIWLYWGLCDRLTRFEKNQQYLFEQLKIISTNLYLISLKMNNEPEKNSPEQTASDIPQKWTH